MPGKVATVADLENRSGVSQKAKVFIGSSQEGREIAACIQQEISDEVDATGWWQGVFALSESTIESLHQRAGTFDFAILVLTPDDWTEKRGRKSLTPRDNVMFELGLFVGVLGRTRTFVVRENVPSLEFPSDLAGITVATFNSRPDNLRAAVGPACTELRAAMRRLSDDGMRESLVTPSLSSRSKQVVAPSPTA